MTAERETKTGPQAVTSSWPSRGATGFDASDTLFSLLGWRGGLHHGNCNVFDRWRFLVRRLPRTRGNGERVLDIGCGTGAFTMGIASRGYEAVGLSWDERNQAVAERRARIARATGVSFPIGDARWLDEYGDFAGAFDIVVCFETVEHIFDDRKLFRDIHRCLKPGGRLYLTTPNYHYRSSIHDMGPFSTTEDGWHVRRGYTPAMLEELCAVAGLEVEEIGYVTFFFSQVVTRIQTRLAHSRLGCLLRDAGQWPLTAPLRLIPPLLDPWLGRCMSRILGWPGYSITLAAYKPRFKDASQAHPAGIDADAQ